MELELNQLTIFCTVSQLAVPICNVIKGVSVVRAKEPCGPHRFLPPRDSPCGGAWAGPQC